MPLKLIILLTLLALSESVTIYSSFLAPLYDRTILNYRVEAPFDPEVAKKLREQYSKEYGYRGERLIAAIGNGNGPSEPYTPVNMYGDVKFYYT